MKNKGKWQKHPAVRSKKKKKKSIFPMIIFLPLEEFHLGIKVQAQSVSYKLSGHSKLQKPLNGTQRIFSITN